MATVMDVGSVPVSSATAFSWLAFSEAERQRAHDALGLLRDRDTRDELGIAGVRDAFSELLFPGTSTIQTRAGYFLFVPWIYRGIESAPGAGAAGRAKRAEQSLIETLRRSDDPDGTIGLRAGPDVQRLPSSVYWQGLRTWRIRRARASIPTYHAWLDHPFRRAVERDDDRNLLDPQGESAWDLALPPGPDNFPDGASFWLRRPDAEYLRDKVMLSCPGTLLAFLVDRGESGVAAPAPWVHPQLAEFPPNIRETLEHAELFSLAMHGAALLYNLQAAERAERHDLSVEYRGYLEEWAAEMNAAASRLSAWPRERFWELARIGNPRIRADARRFIDQWLNRVIPTGGAGLANDRQAQREVTRREISVKGEKQARLASAAALARWSGASGSARMSFRWETAQRIVDDIREAITAARTR